MKRLVINQDQYVGPWVCAKAGGTWVAGRGTTLGLFDEASQRLIAGVLFEDYNGANLLMHVAAEPGRTWLTREFLWFCFYYPFVQLNCRRVTGIIASSNFAAQQFIQRLGFHLEATLKGAHPEGDLLVYALHKQDCCWLTIKKDSHNGQSRRTCRS